MEEDWTEEYRQCDLWSTPLKEVEQAQQERDEENDICTTIGGHYFEQKQRKQPFRPAIDQAKAQRIDNDAERLRKIQGELEELISASKSSSMRKGKMVRSVYGAITGCSELIAYNGVKKMKGQLLSAGSQPFPHYCALAARHDNIYVVGGTFDFIIHLNTVQVFKNESVVGTLNPGEFLSAHEQELPPLTIGRSQHCLAILDGYLLVACGQTATGLTDSSELFDLEKNKWSDVRGPSFAGRLAAITVTRDRTEAYLFGGATLTETKNELYKFELAEKRWSLILLNAPVPSVHSAGLSWMESGDPKEPVLLVFGGVDSQTKMASNKAYEIALKSKTVKPSSPLAQPDTFYGQQSESGLYGLMSIGKQHLHLKEKDTWAAVPNCEWQPLK